MISNKLTYATLDGNIKGSQPVRRQDQDTVEVLQRLEKDGDYGIPTYITASVITSLEEDIGFIAEVLLLVSTNSGTFQHDSQEQNSFPKSHEIKDPLQVGLDLLTLQPDVGDTNRE